MKKSESKKSTKARKHRHQTPSRRMDRAVAKKPALKVAKPVPKSPTTAADNPKPKLSAPAIKPVQPPAIVTTGAPTSSILPCPSPKTQKPETAADNPTPKLFEPSIKPIQPSANVSTAATMNLAPTKTTSPQVQHLDQGWELKCRLSLGASMGELAEKFGCSKSLVRDLVKLADLPEDLKQGYREGKLGRKKVLAMARARVKTAQNTEVIIAEKEVQTKPQPSAPALPQPGVPVKPQSTAAVKPQPSPPVKPDPSLSAKPQPSTPTAMTAEQRRKKVEEYVKMIVDWAHSLDLGYGFWGSLFSQVNFALYVFPKLFTDDAPRPGENWADKDRQEVIKLCKPTEEGDTAPEALNNYVAWLARWIQRVIPDRRMMMDALALAEAALLPEAWVTGKYR